MDLTLLLNNPYSSALLLISIALVALALFSKRIRKISEEQYEKANKSNPYNSKQKDVLSSYCPNCEHKLSSRSLKNRVCENCKANIMLNKTFLMFIYGGVFLQLASLFIESKLPDYHIISVILAIAGVLMILISFAKNRFVICECKEPNN